MKQTLLIPAERWQTTTKVYSSPSRDSLVTDYNLGYDFTFKTIEYDHLFELAAAMQTHSRAIAIYGEPTETAELLGIVPRQTEYFPYPDDQRTHVFDIDKWPIPSATRDLVKPNLLDTKSMGVLINTMLRNEGFEIMAEAEKLVVLTSSSWDTNLLNCHIRVTFDKPIRVEALREFTTALNKVNQRTVFDPAVYKAVQPQFFNPPICVDFRDPYKGKRIFLVPGSTTISLEDFQKMVATTLSLADWDPTTTIKEELPPIGTTWLQTIRNHVGDARGINEPSHRAAAQLVQSVGRQHVLSNINDFAQQMFDETWKTIADKGERGDAKDKSTYTIHKFRQYLKSACDKNFGTGVDKMVQQVQHAIDEALNSNLEPLMSAPTAQALRTLKDKHYPRYLPLEKSILEKHKLLKTRQLGNLLKTAVDETEVISSGDSWNENQLIDTVLKEYDYISDQYGSRFASIPGNGDGGYRMLRVDGSLINVFYADGLKVSDNQVSGQFGKKALSKLLGQEDKAIVSSFEKVMMGRRIVSEDQSHSTPTWINLGLQPDGLYKSAKLEADKVSVMSHQDSKPRWFWGIPSLLIPQEADMASKFNGFTSMMDYLQSELPRFISGHNEDDMTKIIMWMCSTMADKQLAYMLEMLGPAGSGKSTGADFIKDLIDPSGKGIGTGADRTAFWGVNSDFITDIESRHVTILDNISKLSAKEQDLLCMISTGLRHSERILYTQSNMDRTVRKPLIVTALSTIITRPDLKSRVVTVEMGRPEFRTDLIERWHEKKPYFTACLLHLTAKTLQLYRDIRSKPEDIHQRDIFLACVKSAMKGVPEPDFDYVREFRLREAWEASYNSKFIECFIRYLDDYSKGQPNFKITTRGLHQKFQEWCFQNAGKKIDNVTIDSTAVPETGRGMGWELTKNLDTIKKISGWQVTRTQKLVNGKRYTFEKRIDTLNDLL